MGNLDDKAFAGYVLFASIILVAVIGVVCLFAHSCENEEFIHETQIGQF